MNNTGRAGSHKKHGGHELPNLVKYKYILIRQIVIKFDVIINSINFKNTNPKNHGGKSPRYSRVIFEAVIKNKSAKTSSSAPIAEVEWSFLAILPSRKSVRQTAANTTIRFIRLFFPYTNCPVTSIINRMDKPTLDMVMLLGINPTSFFINPLFKPVSF